MIYFLLDEVAGAVKIGCAADVARRVASLQTAHCRALVLLGSVPGDQAAEKRLHRHLAPNRLRGEWFAATPDVKDFLRELLSKPERLLAIPAPVRRGYRSLRLRSLAGQIRRHPRETAAQLVALGQLLREAKAVTGHGGFARWFASIRAGYSMRTATEAMTAARRLAGVPLPLDRFAVSAVRVLAGRKISQVPGLIDSLSGLATRAPSLVTFTDARAAVFGAAPAPQAP